MSIVPKKQRECSVPGTAAAGGPESPLQPDSRKYPSGIVSIHSYLSRNSLHREIVSLDEMHPSEVGQNLLMAGADLLDAPTGTAVAQRSETGQGILGATEGKGMWVWSAVVLAVLSSRMSAGGCSLVGRRDNVPCLAMTAI